MGTENEEELERRRQAEIGERNRQAAAQRAKDLADFQKAEALRKAAEAAAKQGEMVADEPAVPNWPDDGFRAEPGRLDAMKGALGFGPAADAALAAKLLNSGQAPLGSATAPAKGADGANESIAGSPAAKPALGLG